MQKMNKIILLIIVVFLSGCVVTKSTTHRAKAFTPEIYSKKGKVAIVCDSTLKGFYASEAERRQLSLFKSAFEEMGFTVVSNPIGADLGMIYEIGLIGESESGYYISDDYIHPKMLYTHALVAHLFKLDSEGLPKIPLWEGTALATSSRADLKTKEKALIKELFKNFPN